jgi:glycosyltransferase involved in cell wall biosynthesis
MRGKEPALPARGRVSVIVPTYNRGRLVRRAIDSALRAAASTDEIIVVDDGSTDDTEELLKCYLPRIRYVKSVNLGAGAARNLGLDHATGDLVAFLDSDDEWLPDHLALHRALLPRSGCVFSFSNFDVCHDDAPERELERRRLSTWSKDERRWDEILGKGVPYSRFASLPDGREDVTVHVGDLYALMLHRSYVPVWTSLVRRDLAEDQLRFPTDLPTFEDYECYSRLARVGSVAYLDCTTAVNHGHSGPRLTGLDMLVQTTTKLAIIASIWGADKSFLQRNRSVYDGVWDAVAKIQINERLARGDAAAARLDLRTLRRAPLTLRLLGLLPGPFSRLLFRVRRGFRRMAEGAHSSRAT